MFSINVNFEESLNKVGTLNLEINKENGFKKLVNIAYTTLITV